MKTARAIAIFGVAALLTGAAHANEPIASRAHWAALGYLPAPKPVAPRTRLDSALSFHSLLSTAPRTTLPWPVRFEDSRHAMGNVMVQYQNYGGAPYFHGGCDLRTKAGESIVTPVAGRLAGGHYGYSTNADGSLDKQYAAWPADGDRMYFELSVTTDDGTRYEFHHVDRASLPDETIAALDRGNARVEAGTLLGRVITWSSRGGDGSFYHHTHYNVIMKDGTHLNPESFSESIPDTIAPEITELLAIKSDGKSVRIQEGTRLDFVPKEIIVGTTDLNDGNVYVHTPAHVSLVFANGQKSEWDFRRSLSAGDGAFPDIRQVFARAVKTPEGKTIRTQGNYDENFFLMRLPVPSAARGEFTVSVEDQAGNLRTVNASTP